MGSDYYSCTIQFQGRLPLLYYTVPGTASLAVSRTTDFLVTGRPALAQNAGIVFTHWPKNWFFSEWNKKNNWQVESWPPEISRPGNQLWTKLSLTDIKHVTWKTVEQWNVKVGIRAKMWEYSPKNCQNFEFWPEICTSGATRLQYFYEILSICTGL